MEGFEPPTLRTGI